MVFLRTSFIAMLCVAAVGATAEGQATPTATASAPYSPFALPTIGGELRYALTASESIVGGYNGTGGNKGVSAYTNFSGDLAYLSHNPNHQFSAVYAGGYLVGNGSFPSYFYQSLSLSQGYHTKNYNFLVADTINYLPQTPIGSLSGIPGAGDQGIPPVVVSSSPSLGILTTYATRVSNNLSGTVSRNLTVGTSLSLTGSDTIERYTGTSTGFQGINNNSQSGSGTVQHRINERMSVGGQYIYTHSNFSSGLLATMNGNGFHTQSALGIFNRELSPRLNLALAAGPQWVQSGSNLGIVRGTSTNVTASASLGYQARSYNASLSYNRGINNGNGVVFGSRQDSVIGNIARPFARIYYVGALIGWNHSTQLQNSTLANFNSQGVVAGGQLSVQVARSVSAFGSYTVQRQLFGGYAPAGIAFNGLTQYGTIGVTYSPKPIFGRR